MIRSKFRQVHQSTCPKVETRAVVPSVITAMEKIQSQKIKFDFAKASAVLRYALIVLELLLFLRFLMKLMGADTASLFTHFVYGFSQIFIFPFSNVLNSYEIFSIELEPVAILAGVVYWMLYVALDKLLELGYVPKECDCEAEKEYDDTSVKKGIAENIA